MASPDRTRKIALAGALAAAIAIPAEGLRHFAYYDPPGILTVCYGSTTDVQKGRRYTLDECKARLDADMLAAVTAVDRCAPGLPVNVLAAFSDAAYNIGPKVACNTSASTAARLLKAGDYAGACQQILVWDKFKGKPLRGLTTRRQAEYKTCIGGSP